MVLCTILIIHFQNQMKTKLTLLTILLTVTLGTAQDKFDTFNQQKKSIDLRTGICMSYIDTGNSNGIPILLLHGYTDTSRSFQLVIEDLLRINKNMRLIVPDLRGHGQSSMPAAGQCKDAPERCFSQDKFAEDVLDLLDQLRIENVHVVGHSMGSIIAQTLALNHKERVTSMTLIGTFVSGNSCASIRDFLLGELVETDWRCVMEERFNAEWPGDAYSFLPLNMGDRVVNYLKDNWVVEAGAAREFLDAILPETLRIPLGTWIGTIRGLNEVDNRQELKKLTTPTLILWGMDDNITDPKDQERVRAAFLAATKSSGTEVIYKVYSRQTLPGNSDGEITPGHNLHWAAHQSVAEDINKFVAKRTTTNALR